MIRFATLQLYERNLAQPAASWTVAPGITVAIWDSVAAAGPAGSRWHPEAARRFQAGQVCAVACHGEDVVAYCWLTSAPAWVTEIERLVVPGPGDAYLYDAFTKPAWRGRGLFSTVLLQLLAFARAQGKRRALIFVLAENHASRKAIERAGFELFLSVSRVEWWRVSRLWFRGLREARSRVTLVRHVPGARAPGQGGTTPGAHSP